MSLTSASRREVLLALQAELSAAIGAAEPGQVANLSRELRATVAELESLGGTGDIRDPVDQVAAARAARRNTAKGGAS